ncbi:hypothetical protein SAMN04488067_11347 [Halorubrum xinjiangense]|uniref:Uncharacterized protein n=1 Tax=Halorubrum xinjiangense TaxID=261291 RepID=A0A1G7QZB6_9EURY|nr:hypothetical protein SAMN04488067_11347 [Halorubrum xinjiangense]
MKCMARTRALLTETERNHLRSENSNSQRYQAISRIRNRIDDELATDIDILREHHPELYEELRETVCNEAE